MSLFAVSSWDADAVGDKLSKQFYQKVHTFRLPISLAVHVLSASKLSHSNFAFIAITVITKRDRISTRHTKKNFASLSNVCNRVPLLSYNNNSNNDNFR